MISTLLASLVFGSMPLSEPAGDEGKFLSNIRQITTGEMGFINAGEAYFSPDGNTIIFQATPLGKKDYQIYTMDLKAGSPRLVSTGKGACTCAYFHPSGKKIIFASSHLDPNVDQPKEKKSGGYEWDFNEHMDIFEADPDGSNLRRLTTALGYDAEGAYSPDGRHIAFTSNRDGDLEIYAMNADGTDQRRLTSGKGYDGGPFVGPDNRTVLYRGDRRNDGKQNLQIRKVAIDGSGDTAITDNPVFNWCPFWYPTGRCFIFTQADHEAKGRRPNYDLYLMPIDGGEAVRITFDDAFDGLPVFSPDGKRIMWTSKRGGLTEPQIFMADFRLPDAFR